MVVEVGRIMMQEMWAVDYSEIKVYDVMAEAEPPVEGCQYWYVDDDQGWHGVVGDTLFHTKKEALDHLLRCIAAARAQLMEKFQELTEEWCYAE
jgi:hypothetical protein